VGDGELPLYERKGAKESYDVENLLRAVNDLRSGDPVTWPVYSRTLHEPVEKGVPVREGGCICIIEGNYLLLDIEPWSRLRPLFDKRIMILGKRTLMRRRIVSRKTRGGFTRTEAEAHYLRSDALNIAEVIERSAGYDFLLVQRGRYGFTLRDAKSLRR
jgi:pantothenate kinase